MDKYGVLRRYFGYTSFRGGQEALIDGILAGRDVFGVMPTGGGKSLCYQIPALMLPGVTLVVSPLISLMRDQVMALKSAGVAAAYVNSSLTPAQIDRVYRNIAVGMYKIIYIAPERLETRAFLSLSQTLPISLFAVDEAHCISQWGQDFRPGYLKIAAYLDTLPHRPPVAAFTATATEAVRRDIVRLLGLRSPLSILTGFDRPNLRFEVLRPASKTATIRKLLYDREGKSGIIYCQTRAAVESLCESLRSSGISATRYHAGLSEEERLKNQEDFVYDRRDVMVATNAFGMGIDKSDVSFVIHYNMPLSMEAYYQEAGRAGRDGEKADCILLFSPRDVVTAKTLIDSAPDNDALTADEREFVHRQNRARLEQMIGYCRTETCLRAYILSYFGEKHEEKCNNCGNCETGFRRENATREAQTVMQCVQSIQNKVGYSVGKLLLAKILTGSKDGRIIQNGLIRVKGYGAMRDSSASKVESFIDALTEGGYLYADDYHGGISVTQKGREVLYGDAEVTLSVREEKQRPRRKSAQSDEDPLFTELKRVRARIAAQSGVPVYVVFSNATLLDMAQKRPTTLDEFLTVDGVGTVKMRRYGEEFTEAIRDFLKKGR